MSANRRATAPSVDRSEIVDTSDLRKYRTEIPNILDELGLSVYAYRLYGHIKRRAGASEGGRCTEGTARLAASCGMSAGKISTAKQELARAGLIKVHRPEGPTSNADRLAIVDIWPANFAYYDSSKDVDALLFLKAFLSGRTDPAADQDIAGTPLTPSCGEDPLSQYEAPPSCGEDPPSPHETIKEPIEEITNKAAAMRTRQRTRTNSTGDAPPDAAAAASSSLQIPEADVSLSQDAFDRLKPAQRYKLFRRQFPAAAAEIDSRIAHAQTTPRPIGNPPVYFEGYMREVLSGEREVARSLDTKPSKPSGGGAAGTGASASVVTADLAFMERHGNHYNHRPLWERATGGGSGGATTPAHRPITREGGMLA